MGLVDLQINIPNLEEVVDKLSSIPGGAAFAINHAIYDTLKSVRTQATRAARERYNVPYSWVLKSFGNPKVIGMYGLLQSTGARAPLFMFPHQAAYPGGKGSPAAKVSELKSHTMLLRHAFHKGVKVRTGGTGSPRYPVHIMVGRAAPQMINEQGEVWPKVEEFERQYLQERLSHYIDALLKGDIAL